MKIQKPGSCLPSRTVLVAAPQEQRSSWALGWRGVSCDLLKQLSKWIFTAVLEERTKWEKEGGTEIMQPYSCCNTKRTPRTSAELWLPPPGQHLLQFFPALCSSPFPNCRCSSFLFFVSALDNSSRSEDAWTSPSNRSFPSLLLVCFYLLRRLSLLLRLCFHIWVQSSHLLHHWQTSSCGRRIWTLLNNWLLASMSCGPYRITRGGIMYIRC